MSDRTPRDLPKDAVLDLISCGEMEIKGLLPGSSNYTFLAAISHDSQQGLAVYKPSQGESPLWDFPHGTLCQREMAAYLVGEALGWRLVPPTVLRVGPYGRGAVQWFIDADFSQHYFTFREDSFSHAALRQIAAFDLVINNADRKGGHCLLDWQGHIWAIDHGVSFHVQPKLRTVIWDFAGQPLPDDVMEALIRLQKRLEADAALSQSLAQLLSKAEVRALARRLAHLAGSGVYPAPDPYRRSYPWPLV